MPAGTTALDVIPGGEGIVVEETELVAKTALPWLMRFFSKFFRPALPAVEKAINSELIHAAERGVFESLPEAKTALTELSKQITRSGWPEGAILDSAHADRVLVPIGKGGAAVYQVLKNGTARLKTLLNLR